ncbi:hypothetical protein FACS1894170_06450 [Planctomycetales bacterium]|nr:hypothetical protein FACS1894170_06450 [Planctomycetales bacterium]
MKTMTRATFTLGIFIFVILCGVFFFFTPRSHSEELTTNPVIPAQQQVLPRNPLRNGMTARPAAPIQQTALETESKEPLAAAASFDDFPPLTAPPAAASLDSLDDIAEPKPIEPQPVAKPAPKPAASPSFGDAFQPTATPKRQPLATADPFANPQSEATVPVSPAINRKSSVSQQPQDVEDAIEATGTPGESALEGQQTANLVLQKVFPEEVLVEQPVTIKTVIQNVGKSAARKITVTDRVPKGCRLLATIPEATITEQNELRWSLGNLEPNDQIVIETKVLPLREGEIGSVASVNYTSEASVRIAVTKPMLRVEVKAPQEVLLGQVANVEITISNPGSATATGIVLEEHVPDGLYHKDGRILVNKNVNALKAGETKRLSLPLTCTGSGSLVNRVVVTADGNLSAEEKTTIQASAPVLNLQIVGAKERFLDLQSSYKLLVANTGNASAKNVDLEFKLPPSVKFVKTNQSGVYEESTHTVRWALEELPAQDSGDIELVVMPTQIGQQTLKFTANGQNGVHAESVLPVQIDGIPALTFEIVGSANLVEAGKDTVYEIRVTNKGTKAANNVKVSANLADGMSLVKAEGGRYQENGGLVRYETIPLLEPKSEKIYKVAARCQNDGDYRFSVQVISDDLRSPITKEESTRVFR